MNKRAYTHTRYNSWIWRCISIIPFERSRNEDQEFKAILSYTLSMREAWATQTLLQLPIPSKSLLKNLKNWKTLGIWLVQKCAHVCRVESLFICAAHVCSSCAHMCSCGWLYQSPHFLSFEIIIISYDLLFPHYSWKSSHVPQLALFQINDLFFFNYYYIYKYRWPSYLCRCRDVCIIYRLYIYIY